MDARKKKLEEIRRKKLELQQKLKKETGGAAVTQPPTPKDPAIEISPAPSDGGPSNPSTQAPTPSSTPRTHTRMASVLDNPEKSKKLLEIQIKKINESLKEEKPEKSEIFCQGIFPELRDIDTQYVLPQEFVEEQKRQEELLKLQQEKKKAPTFARRASIAANKEVIKKVNLIQFGRQKIKEAMRKITEKNLFYSKNENNLKSFYDKDFHILDEALSSNDIYDICNSYYNEEEADVNISKKTLATHLCDLYDEQCNGRIVTALDWSNRQIDLFLAAFSGTDDFNQQSGLIQLWSLLNRKNPEYVINYQTELTSAIFYKDNPKLVIGGSVTGQIMFWDIKSGKQVPEQKSPLGVGNENSSHCYPIHCLTTVGKDNNLISISTDGVLCEWTLSNLSAPINRYVLNPNGMYDQDKEDLNEIGPLCIGECFSSPNSFIVGTDENDIYNVKLEEKKYDIIDQYKGSKGPIFCVSPHPLSAEGDKSFCDLFLSCGADWSTKLWSTSQPEEPLLTFNQSKDYVYSAKWHPFNPSIFATADGSGYIDIWDLNRDKEIPTFRYDLRTAVNKLAWSCDGKKLATGDVNGHISIFNSEKDVVNFKIEEIKKFGNIIEEIKKNNYLELEKKKKKEMK